MKGERGKELSRTRLYRAGLLQPSGAMGGASLACAISTAPCPMHRASIFLGGSSVNPYRHCTAEKSHGIKKHQRKANTIPTVEPTGQLRGRGGGPHAAPWLGRGAPWRTPLPLRRDGRGAAGRGGAAVSSAFLRGRGRSLRDVCCWTVGTLTGTLVGTLV